MNKFQKERHSAAVKANPYLKLLDKKLLSLGGDTVVLWNPDTTTEETFVQVLLAFGRVTRGSTARLQVMAMGQCHANARELSKKYPKRYQAETGYALSADGCWRPHSWVWDIKESRVVETTETRTKYFGFTERV
jgi:hypothetical protein